MKVSDAVTKGFSPGKFAFGAFFALAGTIFILMAWLGGYTLSIKGLLLPQWVFYLVAAIAILMGAYLMRDSFRTLKCAACKAPLAYAEAFFLAEAAPAVSRACESADPAALAGLPPLQVGKDMVRLSLDYCPRCGKAGVIGARIETPKREKKPLSPPRAIAPEAARGFLPLLRKTPRIEALEIGND
jgi:hypothetical protein